MSILSRFVKTVKAALARDRRCKKASLNLEMALRALELLRSKPDCTAAAIKRAEAKVLKAANALEVAKAK